MLKFLVSNKHFLISPSCIETNNSDTCNRVLTQLFVEPACGELDIVVTCLVGVCDCAFLTMRPGWASPGRKFIMG